MRLWLMSCLALVMSCARCGADEEVRRVQEELRRRLVYTGEIDGRKTDELASAIRRYQERIGFPQTGEVDGDLLRSLGLSAPIIVAAAWPDTAVLKSDAARQLAESDRLLLEKLENIPEPAASKPEAVQPPPAKTTVQPSQELDRPEPEVPPVALGPNAKPLAQEAESFVREYLAACETNQLSAEMAFYADRVDYFDHGVVNRDFIAKDVGHYYRRWPRRDFKLLDFKLSKAAGDELEVKFRISFRVANAEHTVPGRTANTFKIHRKDGEMRFVSLREQRLRE